MGFIYFILFLFFRFFFQGLKITCEVTPHHLFLTEKDTAHLGEKKIRVCPRLATEDDRKALWEHLDVIDCFASDHGKILTRNQMKSSRLVFAHGLD